MTTSVGHVFCSRCGQCDPFETPFQLVDLTRVYYYYVLLLELSLIWLPAEFVARGGARESAPSTIVG